MKKKTGLLIVNNQNSKSMGEVVVGGGQLTKSWTTKKKKKRWYVTTGSCVRNWRNKSERSNCFDGDRAKVLNLYKGGGPIGKRRTKEVKFQKTKRLRSDKGGRSVARSRPCAKCKGKK